MSLSCPVCDFKGITTKWVDHEFQYGTDEDHVMLKCNIPQGSCLSKDCDATWTDYRAEDIMQEVIDHHLKPDVGGDEWVIEATLAAVRADAFSVHQSVRQMKASKVPIKEMDEWNAQMREDWPCNYKPNILKGI